MWYRHVIPVLKRPGQERCDCKASLGDVERPCLRMQVGEEEEELGLTEMRATQPYVDFVIYFQNIPKV